MSDPVVTRFAPSPTGFLHIGGARTALFCYLQARASGGVFILRIEDTDLERSTPESVQAILDGMEWLGLDHDEGPFYQTHRFDRYADVVQQLLDEGKAYHCYCTKEELDSLREGQMQRGERVVMIGLAALLFGGSESGLALRVVIIAVAILHIVNSMAIPVGPMKSYSVYAGTVDAMVQWWYGHNAVGFFLTAGFLGMMYYFVPKQAGRPVYSYRLSVVHFWALIFLYIWAGPHHLLYSSLPNWAQTLGVVFSIMLIAPSWGGMVNGLLTLRGAWDRVREDPVLKFMVVAVTAYGMSTLEGPLMSLKSGTLA